MWDKVYHCSFYGAAVREGHKDWNCECGAFMSSKTGYCWKKHMISKKLNKNNENFLLSLSIKLEKCDFRFIKRIKKIYIFEQMFYDKGIIQTELKKGDIVYLNEFTKKIKLK